MPVDAGSDVSVGERVTNPVLDVTELVDVEVAVGDRILRAQRIRFNPRTDRLYTVSDAALLHPDGAVEFAQVMRVDGKFREALVHAVPELERRGGRRALQASRALQLDAQPAKASEVDAGTRALPPLPAKRPAVRFAASNVVQMAVATPPALPAWRRSNTQAVPNTVAEVSRSRSAPSAEVVSAGAGVRLASARTAASVEGGSRAPRTATAAAEPTELSPSHTSSRLRTAIAQAVERSERDARYRAQRQAAEHETEAVARNRWSPNVRVLAGSTLVGGGINRNGLERTEDGDAGAYAGVGANLTLYDHGRNAVDRELAALGTERADLDRKQAAADIAVAVRDAYYNARLAKAHLSDLRALRGKLADWQTMAARQYEARLITSDTRDAVATALARVDSRIATLEQRLDGERRRWRALTGRDDDPDAGGSGWPASRTGVPGQALESAIAQSPGVQRREVEVRAAELGLEETRRAFGPAVDLSANAVQGAGGDQGVFVGLTGSWPVFDNGVRAAREDAAAAELTSARAARRAETDRLRRETDALADELARLQEEAAADRAISRDANGRLRQVARRFRAEEAGFDALSTAVRRYVAALNGRYVTLRQSVAAENRQLNALGLRGAADGGDPATDS